MSTTTELLSDIRTGAMIPAASAQTFSDTDLLRLADRELQSGIVPLVLSAREEYFGTSEDVALTDSLAVRVPWRAIGAKLAEVSFVVGGGTVNCPQLSLDELHSAALGFYLQGNTVRIHAPGGALPSRTLRLHYYRRPSRLVPVSECAWAGFINPAWIELADAPAAITAAKLVDVIQAKPGFDVLAEDAAVDCSAPPVMTFTGGVPAGVAVGDFICLPGTSPVPQIPLDLHPLLAQRVVCKVLESIGDSAGLQSAQAKLTEIQQAALTLISPRVDNEPRRIVNHSSPFRRGSTWRR